MRAVQQYLWRSILAGITVDEMLPWVNLKMWHVDRRMDRGSSVDAFGASEEKLLDIRNFLWEMMFLLEEGFVSPYEIAEKLLRFVIKIDTPVSEIDKVGISEAEVEVAKFAEEQVMEQEAEEQLEMKGDQVSEEINEVESEDNKEVEEEEPEEDPMFSLDGETEAVEGEQVSEEVKKPEEEPIFSLDDETGAMKGDQVSEEIDEVESEDDKEVEEEEPEEDPMFSLDGETEAVEGEQVSEEVKKPEVKNVKIQDIEDEVEGVIEGDIGYPEKECPVVPAKSTIQTAGNSSSGARNSHNRWQRDESAFVRFKKPRCARIITQFCAWIKKHAVRVQIPIDRLLGVLDLRLEDEVLAKANRRVFREADSVFFC